MHKGFSCDASSVSPIVGSRYHKRGANYDLCAEEFAKISAAEQAKYDVIVAPGATPIRAVEKDAGAEEEASTAPVKLRRSELRLMRLGVAMAAYVCI